MPSRPTLSLYPNQGNLDLNPQPDSQPFSPSMKAHQRIISIPHPSLLKSNSPVAERGSPGKLREILRQHALEQLQPAKFIETT